MSDRELLSQAKKLYAAGLYSVAREYFQQLKDTQPSGPYGELAEIKVADCSFMQRECSVSASQFEDFAKNHPSSRMRPYALIMAAEAHRASYAGLGRDPSSLEKALAQLDQLTASASDDSVYLDRAVALKRELADAIVAHERFVAAFYDRQEHQKAAVARRQYVENQWEPLVAKLAMFQLPESVAHAEEVDYVPPAESAGLSTSSEPVPSVLASATTETRARFVPETRYSVRGIQCGTSPRRQVIVTFNEDSLDRSVFAPIKNIATTEDAIEVHLPESRATPITIDCFGRGDLTVDEHGKITLVGAQEIETLALAYPSRLLMLVTR